MKQKGIFLSKAEGFTLLEVLVAMAIGSVLLTVAVPSIYQVIYGTARSNSQVVVLDEVNRAALQIKKDLQSRDSANISGNSDVLALDWANRTAFESESGVTNHSSLYTLSDMGELRRTYDGTVGIIARQIESISYSDGGDYIDVVITATSPTIPYRSETLSFSVYKRMEE